MIFQKKPKPKSKLVATVTSENKLGFAIPYTEKVELFSFNKTRKSLEKEWKREGAAAIKAALPNRNILKIEYIEFQNLDGSEIK